MSDSPPPIHERLALLAEADEVFKQGVDADNAGDWSNYGPSECWGEAVHSFHLAAVKYQNLGLGLKAREAYSRAAECYRKLAAQHEHWAKVSEESRDSIEILWNGETP